MITLDLEMQQPCIHVFSNTFLTLTYTIHMYHEILMITYHDALIDCNFDTLEKKTKNIIVVENIYCKIKIYFYYRFHYFSSCASN